MAEIILDGDLLDLVHQAWDLPGPFTVQGFYGEVRGPDGALLMSINHTEARRGARAALLALIGIAEPIPMLLYCPECGARHIDEGAFAKKVHHTHSCQTCGLTWRPAVVPTVGVRFLPGFKNAVSSDG